MLIYNVHGERSGGSDEEPESKSGSVTKAEKKLGKHVSQAGFLVPTKHLGMAVSEFKEASSLRRPMKLVRLEKKALESKPNISIRVFDMDEAGHDLLGSCEIAMHKITSAEDGCTYLR